MLLIALAIAAWIIAIVVIIGLAMAAARGDRAQDDAAHGMPRTPAPGG